MEIAIPMYDQDQKLIQPKISTPEKNLSCIYTYKKDFFDPTNSSPPDEFLTKLIKRVESARNIQSR